MKNLMRIAALFVAVVLAAGFVSCGNDDDGSDATPVIYNVTFNTDGGTAVDAQKVNSGAKATKPATDPTKTATAMETYTFAGWYSDSGKTTVFDFDTPITKDITLYAKWTAVYTVIYADGVDGEEIAVPADSAKYKAGDTVTVKFDGIGTRAGYEFAGWSDGTTTYTSNGTKTFTRERRMLLSPRSGKSHEILPLGKSACTKNRMPWATLCSMTALLHLMQAT
ncbi:MAG: InlB B-repeat-containing protein [Treponema sp.]|nr:InlB B-repeat-containing protein [Treponema sp.]